MKFLLRIILVLAMAGAMLVLGSLIIKSGPMVAKAISLTASLITIYVAWGTIDRINNNRKEASKDEVESETKKEENV